MIALALTALLAAPPRVVLLPIPSGDAISQKRADSLTEALAAEVRQQCKLDAFTYRDLSSALSPEEQKRAAECTSDACLAGAAVAVGGDRMVRADVVWDGELLRLHVRLFDLRPVRLIAVADRRFQKGTFPDLLAALPGTVTELRPALERPVEGHAPPKAAAPAEPPPPVTRPEPPSGAAPAAPASDRFVLHYHRRDGRYDGIQLITWESHEGSADLRRPKQSIVPRPYGTLSAPQAAGLPRLAPTGSDAFGPYWSLPASRYRNGRVNFLVTNAGEYDECGAEVGRFWVLRDGGEAWYLSQPDCELYPSLREAEAVQQPRSPPRPARAAVHAPRLAPPAGQVVLHYRRDDERYEGIQLITWESFEGSAELRRSKQSIIPRPYGTLSAPQAAGLPRLEPTGRDGFGVHWLLPASGYRNGRVNFVITDAGNYDECGAEKGRFWIVQDGREAWHATPECEVWVEPESAERALGPR